MGNIALSRRQKIKGQGFEVVKNKDNINKIDVNFDLPSLNLMCYYALSTNLSVKRSHYMNMRNLFEMIDMELYKNDPEKMRRIRFINKALDARLNQNLRNPITIIKYCNDGLLDGDILSIDENEFILSTEELSWINGTISETLKYSFIYNDVDDLLDVLMRFKSSNYLSKGAIVKEIEEKVKRMLNNFRRVASQSVTDTLFTLKDGLFENIIMDTHDKLSSGHNRILSGMQGLNELTYGGFESTRCYIFYGVPGVGKSALAVNLALQIKNANRNYVPKDRTKRPAIVLVTMENSIHETVERIFDIIVTSNSELQKYDVNDVIKMLRQQGELYLSSESPVDIIIKYVPNGSVDTSYLYTLTEELEDEGIETIGLILDYLNCMHSVYKTSDMRIELGNVTAEIKTFAVIKDIPVITFSQLNREAAKMIDAAKLNNQADVTRVLGRAQIAESIIMLYYMDWGAIINVDYDSQGNKYMVFNRFKIRGKCTPRYYICQPFKNPNSIAMEQDIFNPIPIFKETLKDDIANIGYSNSSSRLNNRRSVDDEPQMKINKTNDMETYQQMDRLNNNDNVFLLSRFRQQESLVETISQPTPEEDDDLFSLPEQLPFSPMGFILESPVTFV